MEVELHDRVIPNQEVPVLFEEIKQEEQIKINKKLSKYTLLNLCILHFIGAERKMLKRKSRKSVWMNTLWESMKLRNATILKLIWQTPKAAR